VDGMYKILYNLPQRGLSTLHGSQVLNSSDNIRMWGSPSCKQNQGRFRQWMCSDVAQHSDCKCVLGDCKLDYLSIQSNVL